VTMAAKNFSKSSSLKYLLTLSLLATSFAFIVRNACELSGEFSVVRKNYILDNSTILKLYNQTYQSCKYHCISHHSCKSFNMENKEPGECQLNSKTLEAKNNATWLIQKNGWTYSSTSYKDNNLGIYCQAHKPCKKEQICMSTCTCPGYECLDNCSSSNKDKQDCPPATGLKNCALNKAATINNPISALAEHPTRGNASNAVNGIYETKAYDCALSDPNQSPSEFQVDLGAEVTIHEIAISAGCMSSIDVLISSDGTPSQESCKQGLVFSGYEIRTFECDKEMKGRFVHITGQSGLLLCEVEVYGNC